MPRIMYWNIQKFAINKMTTYTRRLNFTRGRPRYANDIKGDYIIDTIYAEDAAGQDLDPDFLVIVEVTTGRTAPIGSLIDGDGAEGILHLYDLLGAHMRLVPPLVLGTEGNAEGIAVFYRSDRWEFTGPWYWNGAQSQPTNVGAQNYGGAWANVLPAGASRQRAGQAVFTNAAGNAMEFPNPGQRAPFLTSFREIAAPNRLLNLLAFHAPSWDPAREQGTRALADIPAIANPLAANETTVVLGDFNCNLADPDQADAYTPLINAGYQQCITANPNRYSIYTALKDIASRSGPYNASTAGNYPGYNYMRPLAVDNIFIKPPRAPIPVCHIVNRIIGTPVPANAAAYTVPNVAGARPANNLYSIGMEESIQQINQRLPAGAARMKRFNALPNFGKIGGKRGTSDHMALMIEI